MKILKQAIFCIFFNLFLFAGVFTQPIEQNDKEGYKGYNNTLPNNASTQDIDPEGISGSPETVTILTGTGTLGRKLGFKENSGIRIGGLISEDYNYLFQGGLKPRKGGANNVVMLGLNLYTEKLKWWKGGLFGIDLLQFNMRPVNDYAGCVQGYNNNPGPPPLDRFELYQLWYRHEWYHDKLIFYIGKIPTTRDFTNIVRPILTQYEKLFVPATSGLIYTSLYVNATMIGVVPGFYNSAYGFTLIARPKKSFYISYGLYDGNLARNKQTGLRGPQFNGYYFNIAETGMMWSVGKEKLLGTFAFGGWYQSGRLKALPDITQRGTSGIYLFGSQWLWKQNPGKDNSGVLMFVQGGANWSKTLPMNQFAALGMTFFGLIPHRKDDSFGYVISCVKLNPKIFKRKNELLLQGYYQFFVYKDVYFSTIFSYIPRPGANPPLPSSLSSSTPHSLKSAYIGTIQLIILF